MTEPSICEVHPALRTPVAHVVVLHFDGFEVPAVECNKAALDDLEREVAILSGRGWAEFEHPAASPEPVTDRLDREWRE